MSDPRIRTLKIKTGVVKRLAKEKVTYEKEAAQQRERIQKLKEQGEVIFSYKGRKDAIPYHVTSKLVLQPRNIFGNICCVDSSDTFNF